MIINVSEAKANLSKLINMVCQGEEVVIAKNNLPLVDLVIHKHAKKRKFGLLEDQFSAPDDLIEEDYEINQKFYNSDK